MVGTRDINHFLNHYKSGSFTSCRYIQCMQLLAYFANYLCNRKLFFYDKLTTMVIENPHISNKDGNYIVLILGNPPKLTKGKNIILLQQAKNDENTFMSW